MLLYTWKLLVKQWFRIFIDAAPLKITIRYWLYSLCCTMYSSSLCILYLGVYTPLIPSPYPALPPSLSPLRITSFFSVLVCWHPFLLYSLVLFLDPMFKWSHTVLNKYAVLKPSLTALIWALCDKSSISCEARPTNVTCSDYGQSMGAGGKVKHLFLITWIILKVCSCFLSITGVSFLPGAAWDEAGNAQGCLSKVDEKAE